MAEDSMLWTTSGVGDGVAGGFTQQNWLDLHRYFFTPDTEGTGYVLPRKGNKLACTAGASSVNVDTGAAWVYGFFYKNTASLNLPITTPVVGTTGLRVVLRAGWAAQTVRAAVIRNTDGVAGIPAATQTPGTTYEVTLATGTITTGGVVTLTDARGYVQIASVVTGAMLDVSAADNSTLEVISNVMRVKDAGITAAKIAAAVAGNGLSGGAGSALAVNVDATTIEINADILRVKDDGVDDLKVGNRVLQMYRRQGGSATSWRTAGATTQTPGMTRAQAGVRAVTFSGGSVGTQAVTFPVAFSQVPIVFCTPLDAAATNFAAIPDVITASGFTIRAFTTDGSTLSGTIDCAFFAIGTE